MDIAHDGNVLITKCKYLPGQLFNSKYNFNVCKLKKRIISGRRIQHIFAVILRLGPEVVPPDDLTMVHL